jgi:hypothetical protein
MQGTENRTDPEKKSPGQEKKIPRRDSAPKIAAIGWVMFYLQP